MADLQAQYATADPETVNLSDLANKMEAITPPPELADDWPGYIEMERALGSSDSQGDLAEADPAQLAAFTTARREGIGVPDGRVRPVTPVRRALTGVAVVAVVAGALTGCGRGGDSATDAFCDGYRQVANDLEGVAPDDAGAVEEGLRQLEGLDPPDEIKDEFEQIVELVRESNKMAKTRRHERSRAGVAGAAGVRRPRGGAGRGEHQGR